MDGWTDRWIDKLWESAERGKEKEEEDDVVFDHRKKREPGGDIWGYLDERDPGLRCEEDWSYRSEECCYIRLREKNPIITKKFRLKLLLPKKKI